MQARRNQGGAISPDAVARRSAPGRRDHPDDRGSARAPRAAPARPGQSRCDAAPNPIGTGPATPPQAPPPGPAPARPAEASPARSGRERVGRWQVSLPHRQGKRGRCHSVGGRSAPGTPRLTKAPPRPPVPTRQGDAAVPKASHTCHVGITLAKTPAPADFTPAPKTATALPDPAFPQRCVSAPPV